MAELTCLRYKVNQQALFGSWCLQCSLFNTDDIQKQQDILFQAANLIDAGRIKSIASPRP